jgi:PPOX class probable F420-dependent enzyme
MAYTVNSDRPTSIVVDGHAPAVVPVTELPFTALGGQPGFEPGPLDAFLAAARIAVLAYVRSDGRPNQVPLWYSYHEGALSFSFESTSAKVRALRKDPRVTVTVQDERPPYRAVIIDGTVEMSDLDDEAEANMALAVRYFGKVAAAKYESIYREAREAAGTTLVRLVPSEVKGFDNTRAIDRATLGFVRLRHVLPIPRRWL